jgi:hypothetical protein
LVNFGASEAMLFLLFATTGKNHEKGANSQKRETG